MEHAYTKKKKKIIRCLSEINVYLSKFNLEFNMLFDNPSMRGRIRVTSYYAIAGIGDSGDREMG